MEKLNSIEILGGGLAGLLLGIGLRHRQIPVRVREAGFYPRHRVCGELLSYSGQKILHHFKLVPHLTEAVLHHTVSWWLNHKKIFTAELPQPSLGVSRYLLDQTLSRHFNALGGELYCGQRAELTNKKGEVDTRGRARVESDWFGMKVHLKNFVLETDLEMHLGRKAYVGLSKVEEGWVNCCGLFHRTKISLKENNRDILLTLLRSVGLNQLAERIEKAERREGSQTAVAGFRCGIANPSSTGLVLGDRERMIPPFTGHGMSMALEAAFLALEPLEAYAHHKITWEQCCHQVNFLLRQRFRRPMQVASWLHPWLVSSQKQKILEWLCIAKLLPFKTLFHFVR